MSDRKRLFLLDGSAIFYRSYFAFIRNPLFNSRGENTSAIFGFTNTLMKILTEEKPDEIAVVFDTKEPTFRHKKYESYKATREKMPDEMAAQYPKIVELVEAFNIPVIEKTGYEADDVIGTLARQAEARGLETFMVTGDKDFMQLITPHIHMYAIRPGKETEIFDNALVEERFGMKPGQVIDYLAMMGDSSDNVPGIAGVGEKTAKELIANFGSLDNLYSRLDEVGRPALRKKIETAREIAYLSRELVTIDTHVPLNIDFESLKTEPADGKKLLKVFEFLEFRQFIERIPEFTGDSSGAIKTIESIEQEYTLIQTKSQLKKLAADLGHSGFFVFDTETTGLNIFESDIIGIAFSTKSFTASYVPLNNPESEFSAEEVIEILKDVLEDEKVAKGGQNIKFDALMLWQHGIRLRGIAFDTMVAHYLINPGTRQHNLDLLAFTYLNYKMVPIEQLIGKKGKKQKNMLEVPVSEVYPYACEDADITFRLKEILQERLRETETLQLFNEVEMPLLSVLIEMEKNGVRLDMDFLKEMSGELQEALLKVEQEIYRAAGSEFNINSPQQLGQILFENLQIHKELGNRRPSRTATGQFSTSEAVLEKFSDHPIVGMILEYRKLAKLKSTYVDALPNLVSKRTGRLHTSFNQTVAATGRLSSSDPNLQNIPIRTDLGRKIRQSFIPENPADYILSADYSQVELRMMAHLSGDEGLRKAFERGEDIHATTAAAIFNIPIEMVNPDHRRKAKEVNFGIIYGISPYGLASRLKIEVDEARQIIESYFARFPKVNDYMAHAISFATQNKYVTTILNRRRYIPEIESTNAAVRQNADRIAINATIQGSAADLIKIAMIHIQRKLEKSKFRTKMILQVHDELVFEVAHEELESIKSMVTHEMEHAIELSVPIRVDAGIGKNWLEAH